MNNFIITPGHNHMLDNLPRAYNAASATQQAPQYGNPELVPSMAAGAAQAAQAAQPSTTATLSPGLAWPPGFAGAIAHYIYDSSIRPVPEVAIVGALGLLAGICGKSWATPGEPTGLNLYIVLVARSAIGKEAMHKGISALINIATKDVEMTAARQFVNFSDFASGQALQKATAVTPCFVNVTGEFGIRLKQIANSSNKPDSPMQNLRRVLVNLYSKSGPDSVAGGIAYSNKDNNVASVSGVAYSLIGETTPGTFYDLITPDMMADGFMSRFCVVEYKGERPEKNPHTQLFSKPQHEQFIPWLKQIMSQAITLQQRGSAHQVGCEQNAWSLLEKFDLECDEQINRTNDESWRQMWNRAYLKVLKLASILAVADHCISPSITTMHVEWAIGFVRRDISAFTCRLEEGDIGEGDDAREKKLLAIAKEYLQTPFEELPKSAAGMKLLREKGIITRKYIQTKTANVAAFKNHPLRATKAMEQAISSLIKNGYFSAVAKTMLIPECQFHGEAYLILDIPGHTRPEPTSWVDRFLEKADSARG